MAVVQLSKKQYGVVELNHVAAVKTGQIKAQYELNATDFATIPAQNGMLLVVDDVAKDISLPTAITNVVYLHASVEKDYEGKGRAYCAVNRGEFLPRLYKLAVGDIFETNMIEYDNAVYATYAAMVAAINATTVYGIPSTSGSIRIVAALGGTEVVALKAVEGVTLPNGESGIKFVVALA